MDHLEFAKTLALKAGEIMRKNFSAAMTKEWKSNNTPVTATDLAINQMVMDECLLHFPDYGILAEEESRAKDGAEFVWVCDPVDGTIPFSHGIPTSVFSLALVKNGEPILGVIYDPFMDRLFWAEKGKGAFLNGQVVHVNKRGLDNSVISWESWGPKFASDKKVLVVTLACVIYGGMLVASGELVGAFYDWVYAHDAASLKIIVEEAGGKVTDKEGKEQRYDGKINGAIISNGVVHQELLDFIKANNLKTWDA